MSRIDDLVLQWRELGPVKWAEHPLGWMHEGKPITLTDWQRAVLEAWWTLRLLISTLAISNIKKTGKTTLDAILLCWRWLALPGQHYVCANDFDQSQGLQFRMIAQMVKQHPFLSQHVRTTASKLIFEPTGSELEALSVDAAGSAGSLHLTSSHTEAWGIQQEGARRAWEELTPQPGQFYGFPALRIADSYAGWTGESITWQDLVDRGLAGKRASRKWPLFRTEDGLLLFHITGERAQKRCFRGTAAERRMYYHQQRASLRPMAYKRMHENVETASESAFITEAQWDALPVGHSEDILNWWKKTLSVGLDIGVKSDYSAVVGVFAHEGRPYVGPWRVWRPPNVSFEAIEEYIVGLTNEWSWVNLHADPYQAAMLLQRLESRSGLRVNEFPQTQGYLTEAGNGLFEAIRDQRLVVPPGSGELRDAALAATAKETPRGIRLVKTTQGRKIDLAISLAMALARLDLSEGKVTVIPGSIYDRDTGEGSLNLAQEYALAGSPPRGRWTKDGGITHSPAWHKRRTRRIAEACKEAGGQKNCRACRMRMHCLEVVWDQ